MCMCMRMWCFHPGLISLGGTLCMCMCISCFHPGLISLGGNTVRVHVHVVFPPRLIQSGWKHCASACACACGVSLNSVQIKPHQTNSTPSKSNQMKSTSVWDQAVWFHRGSRVVPPVLPVPPVSAKVVSGTAALTPCPHARGGLGLRQFNKLPEITIPRYVGTCAPTTM